MSILIAAVRSVRIELCVISEPPFFAMILQALIISYFRLFRPILIREWSTSHAYNTIIEVGSNTYQAPLEQGTSLSYLY